MEKRVFLAIALSLLVLTGYQYLVPPVPTPAPASVAAPGASASATTSTTPASGAPTAFGAAPATMAPAPAINPAARDIVVDTDSIQAVFSTQGAVLKHWRLKHYNDNMGQPLDLIPVQVPAAFARPFSLSTSDAALTASMAAAVYQASAGDLSLGSNPGVLSFDYRDPASGLNVHKSFQFQPKAQPFVINVEATIDVAGAAKPVTIDLGPSVGVGYNEQGSRYGYPNQAVLSHAGKWSGQRPRTLRRPRRTRVRFVLWVSAITTS